ncbi:hypothetical protein EGH25_06895 [Haladaptatus sp. F3-133]|uniref:Uncharacterized protein n=1 Tax=Halorutilus salinus TaxID=2487751 RepID=A0A9Q4C4U1_9EURY|nr:hypothetical protein [Halorutilus salinus]MCX2819077.1 hypothetical protein [Halorutilus salinus]
MSLNETSLLDVDDPTPEFDRYVGLFEKMVKASEELEKKLTPPRNPVL